MGQVNVSEIKIDRDSGLPGQPLVSQGPDLPSAWGDSLVESCSQMYITVTAPTTLAVADTFYKLLGTAAAYQLINFTVTDNRLTYIGDYTQKFSIIVPFSMSSNTKDIVVSFQINKNGSAGGIVASRIKRTLRAVGDIFLMALASIVELQTDDYVELWVASNTPNVQITLETMSFLVCD